MVELFPGRLPLEDTEPLPVMLRMTAGAIGVSLGVVGNPPVHALVVLDQFGDFAVAVQAFQPRFSSAEAMTHGALQRTIQRLMRFGKGSRRDLRLQRQIAEKCHAREGKEDSGRQSQAGRTVQANCQTYDGRILGPARPASPGEVKLN